MRDIAADRGKTNVIFQVIALLGNSPIALAASGVVVWEPRVRTDVHEPAHPKRKAA